MIPDVPTLRPLPTLAAAFGDQRILNDLVLRMGVSLDFR
jgi:hypothetical protein